LLLFLLGVSRVNADGESLADQFLGSPLLILVGILVIVGVAFVYHRMRK
jgi:hypothetical protein